MEQAKPMQNESMKRTGGWKRKLLVIFVPIFILLTAFIGLSLMKAGQKKPEVSKRRDPTLAVMAVPAYEDTVVLDVTVQGQTRPRTEVDMSPQVGGKIVYVSPNFVAGGQFRRGEVLLRIEEADFKVAVLRAEAAVARAEQLVVREKAEGAIAAEDWKDLGRGGEPSALTLRKPQLAEAEAGLKSAQADLDNAKLQLSRTNVTAPFSGRIRTRFADIGQFVGPGTRLAQVFATDAVEIPLSLNDADLTRLDLPLNMGAHNKAPKLDVELSAVISGKRRRWYGQIVRTDGVFDPQTRTFSAIAEVRDPFGKGASEDGFPLPPGLFVDAEITGKTLENAIVIPRDSLRPEDKVYVVDDKGEAQSRDTEVLDTNAERAIIKGGVEAGELVIISPLEKSQISLKFKVLDANDPTTVLIEPPKPDWMKEKKKEEPETKKGFFGRKKKDSNKAEDADAKAKQQPLKKSDQPKKDSTEADKDSGASAETKTERNKP
jgi:RND family efflux transporter MFP subunit